MLKITQVPDGDRGLLLRLEGKLLEPWIGELAAICEGAAGRRLRLDLSAVSFADAAGVRFLRDRLDRGAAVASCSGFVAELLRQGGRS